MLTILKRVFWYFFFIGLTTPSVVYLNTRNVNSLWPDWSLEKRNSSSIKILPMNSNEDGILCTEFISLTITLANVSDVQYKNREIRESCQHYLLWLSWNRLCIFFHAEKPLHKGLLMSRTVHTVLACDESNTLSVSFMAFFPFGQI